MKRNFYKFKLRSLFTRKQAVRNIPCVLDFLSLNYHYFKENVHILQYSVPYTCCIPHVSGCFTGIVNILVLLIKIWYILLCILLVSSRTRNRDGDQRTTKARNAEGAGSSHVPQSSSDAQGTETLGKFTII